MEEREVEMSIEGICLETGKPVEDFDRPLSNQRQIDERLSNPDVGSVVGTRWMAGWRENILLTSHSEKLDSSKNLTLESDCFPAVFIQEG